MRFPALCSLLLASLPLAAQETSELPDVEAQVRQMMKSGQQERRVEHWHGGLSEEGTTENESAEAEPPLLSGADAPPLDEGQDSEVAADDARPAQPNVVPGILYMDEESGPHGLGWDEEEAEVNPYLLRLPEKTITIQDLEDAEQVYETIQQIREPAE